MRNIWILINSRADYADSADGREVALETFETHLSTAYVLPDSNVFLLVRTGGRDARWVIWEGFRAGKTDRIRVYRHGSATAGRLEVFENDSVSFRSDLRGITLKATTVVREFYIFTFGLRSMNTIEITRSDAVRPNAFQIISFSLLCRSATLIHNLRVSTFFTVTPFSPFLSLISPIAPRPSRTYRPFLISTNQIDIDVLSFLYFFFLLLFLFRLFYSIYPPHHLSFIIHSSDILSHH